MQITLIEQFRIRKQKFLENFRLPIFTNRKFSNMLQITGATGGFLQRGYGISGMVWST